jgi:acyl-CoA thioesterase
MQRLELPSPDGLASGDCYAIDVAPHLCTASGLLFGGWAMAAMIEAAQAWSGRHVRALAVSFLAPVQAGDELRITLTALRSGSRLVHCRIDGQAGNGAVLSAVAVAGPAAGPQPQSWASVPSVRPPEQCEQRSYRFPTAGTAMGSLDVRLASPEPSPEPGSVGRCLLWGRLLAPASAEATLALLSDHVPYLVLRTIPGLRHATTVSASVRITGAPSTPWTLLDVELTAADGVFCVGHLRLWSEQGALVATADQTVRTVFEARQPDVAVRPAQT